MKLNQQMFWAALCLSLLVPAWMARAEEDGFGLSAAETYAWVQSEGESILFIDVRDPVEIQFVGFTDVVDLNIPFRVVDRTQLNWERGVFAMPLNPHFADAVRTALRAKGLEDDAKIITMCRSGSDRGMPSAAYLRDHGFPHVFFVRHGFQGDPLAEGPQKGMRLKNGWQNEGLPWSPQMNLEKIYSPEM